MDEAEGLQSIHWTVQDDTTEKVPVHKHTYYPEQLALIAERLDDFGKMCLAVGLNCAMGAAELGRLTREDFLPNYQHEFQRKLKFKSTSEDSFCREFRPKTKIFGEWILARDRQVGAMGNRSGREHRHEHPVL